MLPDKYSRLEFEDSSSPTTLSDELALVLTDRLCSAPNPEKEVELIISDLKILGHDIYNWDYFPGEFEIWCDSYLEKEPANRIELLFRYSEETSPKVEVVFGPWPSQRSAIRCPNCDTEMEDCQLLLRINGYGSADAGIATHYRLSIGSRKEYAGEVSTRSITVKENTKECPKCGGVWIPASHDAET